MNHAITLGGLLCVLGILAGLVGCAVGALMFFAGMMSDDVSSAQSTSAQGLIVAAVSGAVLIFSIVKLL